MLPYHRCASGGSAGLLPANSRPVKPHSAGPSFQLPSCGCCTSFICTATWALLGLSIKTGCLRSATSCLSVPSLWLTEQSKAVGMSRAGNVPLMLDGAFPHFPKYWLLFPVTCPSDGCLNWILEIMKAVKAVTPWWELTCYITGDYPLPTQ